MIDNEDWVKSRKWDLYCVGTLVTTVPGLLWAINATDLATPDQVAAVQKFTQLPAWTPAPAVLKDAVNNFVRSRGAIRQSTMEWRGSFDPDLHPHDEKDRWSTTAGDGKPSALPKAVNDFIQKQVDDFHAAGGTIKVLSKDKPGTALLAARRNYRGAADKIQDMVNMARDDDDYAKATFGEKSDGLSLDRIWEGVDFTGVALNYPGAMVAVAYDALGNVAGAMSYTPGQSAPYPNSSLPSDAAASDIIQTVPLHIGYLGSMGRVPGTGTALQIAVAQAAAATGSAIQSEATYSAVSYHESIGRTVTDDRRSSWTVEQVKAVAAITPSVSS